MGLGVGVGVGGGVAWVQAREQAAPDSAAPQSGSRSARWPSAQSPPGGRRCAPPWRRPAPGGTAPPRAAAPPPGRAQSPRGSPAERRGGGGGGSLHHRTSMGRPTLRRRKSTATYLADGPMEAALVRSPQPLSLRLSRQHNVATTTGRHHGSIDPCGTNSKICKKQVCASNALRFAHHYPHFSTEGKAVTWSTRPGFKYDTGSTNTPQECQRHAAR